MRREEMDVLESYGVSPERPMVLFVRYRPVAGAELALSVFRIRIDDEIFFGRDAFGVSNNANFPSPTERRGLEFQSRWPLTSMLRAAFNPHFTLDHVLADGDKVAVMWTNEGTHVAEWFGIPATGKSIVTQGVDVFLLRDGRLAEHWDVVDVTDFLTKTGALQAPTAAPGGAR